MATHMCVCIFQTEYNQAQAYVWRNISAGMSTNAKHGTVQNNK